MKLEEITLERVKKAYETTGTTPAKFKEGNYKKEKKVCALEVLALEQNLLDIHGNPNWVIILDDVFKSLYFAWGFDGRNFSDSILTATNYIDNSEEYKKGRQLAKDLGL